MAEDWAADVKKYVADADDKVIAAIVQYCGIALRSRDSSLVSFSDPVETGRVRENFLKKKLGLTRSDEELDGAIAEVGKRMKGDPTKNRVTVYYLLLEHFGLLHLFGGADVSSASAIPAAAAATGTYGAYDSSDTGSEKTGLGWWPWLLLALLALALIWWLFLRNPAAPVAVAPVNEVEATANASGNVSGNMAGNMAGNMTDFAMAPAEGTVTIPTGAGVTVESRDGKPVAKVYFDTGKADVVPAFSATAAGLQSYLASHAGSKLEVSGFNDPTGNAAANAELSKNRAQAVKAALVAGGIADASVELVKPADTTDSSTSNDNARRVEVVVR